MSSRQKRRGWRAEFKSLGVRQTADRERHSVWHATPGKPEEVRRWLENQARRPTYIVAAIGAVATVLPASQAPSSLVSSSPPLGSAGEVGE
jgi:hypothetical protein